ncbi:MAG TPA: recombination regulator RecX [Burkholderiales bacterium]|nr:recombination regulator RecX [Burkholderiales bacterium]
MAPRKQSLSELSLKARAVAFLARREHTRRELARKLAPHAESAEQMETLLDELVQQGFLSDERFVESRVNARIGRYGSRRIAQELLEKGVSETLVTEAVANLKADDLQTARALWARKFDAQPKDAKEKARQIRFLQSRGFSFDIIRQVLGQDD